MLEYKDYFGGVRDAVNEMTADKHSDKNINDGYDQVLYKLPLLFSQEVRKEEAHYDSDQCANKVSAYFFSEDNYIWIHKKIPVNIKKVAL